MAQEKYALQYKYTVKESRDLLEYLVNQKLTEWQIYNVDPSSDNYIGEEKMKACIEYIMRKIMDEMTPAIRDILAIGYPMDTEVHQLESIKRSAMLAVLNYSIKQNEPQEHQDVIKNINAF